MKLGPPPVAPLVSLVLSCSLAFCACRGEGNTAPASAPGLVRTEQPPSAGPPPQPGTSAVADSPCRIAHIEWRDRSTPQVLKGAAATDRLKQAVARRMESGEPGWTLFLELAVAPAAEGVGQFHFGVRGFLKDLNQVPAPVLEASASGEQGSAAVCDDGWTGAECRESLWRAVLASPLEKVLGELSFLCEVRQMDGAGLVKALERADSWQQAELARGAGELGDTTVIPALRPLLDADEAGVQLRAIAALGRLQDEGSVPRLVRLTQGAPEAVVHAVMVALADIESAEARRYLQTWAEHHPLLSMRELAGELLKTE